MFLSSCGFCLVSCFHFHVLATLQIVPLSVRSQTIVGVARDKYCLRHARASLSPSLFIYGAVDGYKNPSAELLVCSSLYLQSLF